MGWKSHWKKYFGCPQWLFLLAWDQFVMEKNALNVGIGNEGGGIRTGWRVGFISWKGTGGRGATKTYAPCAVCRKTLKILSRQPKWRTWEPHWYASKSWTAVKPLPYPCGTVGTNLIYACMFTLPTHSYIEKWGCMYSRNVDNANRIHRMQTPESKIKIGNYIFTYTGLAWLIRMGSEFDV
jgi:hypothetical protein